MNRQVVYHYEKSHDLSTFGNVIGVNIFTLSLPSRFPIHVKNCISKTFESKNKTRGKNMSEAFLPWLDKLQKLYNGSDGRDISDTDESQEWINKLRNRITQKKCNEKLNKELYKHVSSASASVTNLASNTLSYGYFFTLHKIFKQQGQQFNCCACNFFLFGIW